jgi:hypothetical protein
MFLLLGLAVQASGHIYKYRIGIGIGILLYKAMNVGLILWLGIAQT